MYRNRYALPFILNHKHMFFSVCNIFTRLRSMVFLRDMIFVILLVIS